MSIPFCCNTRCDSAAGPFARALSDRGSAATGSSLCEFLVPKAFFVLRLTRVPNRRIGGSGTSTLGRVRTFADHAPHFGFGGSNSMFEKEQVPDPVWPLSSEEASLHKSLVPNRRIGGSGALTRDASLRVVRSLFYSFVPVSSYPGLGSDWGDTWSLHVIRLCLVLLLLQFFTEPGRTELETTSAKLCVRTVPKRSRRSKPKVPEHFSTRASGSGPQQNYGPWGWVCLFWGLCSTVCLHGNLCFEFGLGASWVEQQAASAVICAVGGFGASLLCICLRQLGFGISPLGRLALGALADTSPALAVGFGQAFIVQHRQQRHASPACSSDTSKSRSVIRYRRGIWTRFIGVLMGFVGMPASLAVQRGPPLSIPLSLVYFLYPGGVAAMTAPDSEWEWLGSPGRIRPHERPVNQLVHHVGPPVQWPATWGVLRGEPDGSPPKIKTFDDARNPGTHRTQSGETVRWLGAIIYTPNIRPVLVALREIRPLSIHSYIDIVIDSAPGVDFLTYKCCVPVVPQRFNNSLTLLRYPCHIKDMPGGELFAVAVDLSRVGGMYYACILPSPLPYDDLIQYLLPQTSYDDAPLRIFIGDSGEQHRPGQPVHLFDGVVILAVRPVYEWGHIPQPSRSVQIPRIGAHCTTCLCPRSIRGSWCNLPRSSSLWLHTIIPVAQ